MSEIGIVIVLLAVAAVGAVAMLHQMIVGMSLTALAEPVVWGLYVVGFAFFTGLGAMSLSLAAAAISWGDQTMRGPARICSAVAFASIAAAGLFIFMDVGRPDRAWMLALKPMVQSPLTLDFFILNGMLVLAAIFVFFTLRREVVAKAANSGNPIYRIVAFGHRDGADAVPTAVKVLATLTALAVPVAYLITARVFTSLRARPAWNTTGLGLTFMISASLSAIAAVVLAVGVFLKNGLVSLRESGWLRRIIGIVIALLVLDLVMTIGPAITMLQWGSPPRIASAHIDGILAAEVIVGMLIPLALLVLSLRKPSLSAVSLASVLILAGAMMKRWSVIIHAMEERSLLLAPAHYAPNAHELMVSIGIIAISILLLYFIGKLGGAWLPCAASTEKT